MAGTMTNIENNTIRMYWNALRSMSKNIRLGLAVKLTNSVLEEERKEMSDEAYTEEMLNKFFGKWEGNETAEELMGYHQAELLKLTENVKHLARIEGLEVQNWVER